MIALLQRVSSASVSVDETVTGSIGQGLMVLLGIQADDTQTKAKRLAERTLNYRIFADAEEKMNLNVQQISGEVLVVSQFTLVANTHKGNRPSFQSAAKPETSEPLYELFCNEIASSLGKVSTGIFGANMQVSLINDGPVTFWLET